MNNENDVTSESLVNPPSSATGVTRDGKFSSRILPAEGGRTRTSIPLARNDSAGGAVRSPEEDPPSHLGQTWEGGDVGGGATPDRQPLAAAAIVGNPIIPDEGAKFTLVITRIDYCNSILAGLPACRLVTLQRVQYAAARLVLNLDRRAHISPALQQLHALASGPASRHVKDSHTNESDLTKTLSFLSR